MFRVLHHVVTPTIDSVSPATVAPGATTTITVTGDYFDLTSVEFDSDADVSFGLASPTGNSKP